MKALIFDTGSLITLSMNGLLYIIEELKKSFNGKFLMTEDVKYEIIDRPIGVPRFELGALRVQKLIESKIIEMPSSTNIENETIKKETQRLMEIANHYIKSKGKWINIISKGETSCLALSLELRKKGIENIIVVDERTTRLLAEKPQNLKKLMEKKLHSEVRAHLKNLHEFKDFKFIRSTELVFVAHKKNLLKLKGPKALEAALYATKYKGSSVSFDEIKELKKL